MSTFTCPRRLDPNATGHGVEYADGWRDNDTCSYCGALRPSVALHDIEEGNLVIPTNNNYETRVMPDYRKVFFEHFTLEHKKKFVDLYNSGMMKMTGDGKFPVLPFFMSKIGN